MALYTFDDLTPKTLNKALSEAVLTKEAVEAPRDKEYDIFLSHSYFDAEQILTLKMDFEAMAFSVYVDWVEDSELDRRSVSWETADRLRWRMEHCACLLYVHSENAELSKWMPWELGYFDAKKGRVGILPISFKPTTDFPAYHGREYLGLYCYVDKCPPKGSSTPTLWVNKSPYTYINLRAWVNGQEPYERWNDEGF